MRVCFSIRKPITVVGELSEDTQPNYSQQLCNYAMTPKASEGPNCKLLRVTRCRQNVQKAQLNCDHRSLKSKRLIKPFGSLMNRIQMCCISQTSIKGELQKHLELIHSCLHLVHVSSNRFAKTRHAIIFTKCSILFFWVFLNTCWHQLEMKHHL